MEGVTGFDPTVAGATLAAEMRGRILFGMVSRYQQTLCLVCMSDKIHSEGYNTLYVSLQRYNISMYAKSIHCDIHFFPNPQMPIVGALQPH